MKNVAFIGIGKMGAQMAARLVSAGFKVTVFDPNRSAVDELVSKGAAAAANPKSAAEGADAVLFSLPTPAILRSATNGKLVVMVGGDAAVLERVTPMLNNLAGRIVHCGAIGAGQLTKLSHNLVVAINTVALGEVLAASVKAGGNLEVLCDVMSAGMAGSKMLDWFQKTLFTAERPAFFAIDLMNKDLGLCLDEFSNYPMPLGQLVKQTYNAARAKGMGGKDSTSVSEIYEELLGVRLQTAA